MKKNQQTKIPKNLNAYYLVTYKGEFVGPYASRNEARADKLNGEKIIQLKPVKVVR